MEFIKLLLVAGLIGSAMYGFTLFAGWIMSGLDQPKNKKYTGKL